MSSSNKFLLRFLIIIGLVWVIRGHYFQDLWWQPPSNDCYKFFNIESFSQKNNVFCAAPTENSTFEVAVIGDSMANSLYPGINNYYKKTGIGVINLGMGTCAPFRNTFGNLPWNYECNLFNDWMFDYLIQNHNIKTVFLIFNHWDIGNMYFDGGRTPLSNDAQRLSKMRLQAKEDIDFLKSHGKKIVISYDSPHVSSALECIFYGTCSYSSKEGLNTKFEGFWDQVFDGIGDICIFSELNVLSENNTLPFIKDNHLLYRDNHHLSIFGANYVVEKMKQDPCINL